MTKKSNSVNLPQEVLNAAQREWKLFPVEKGGKKPLICQWQNRATSDIKLLRRWAQKFRGCNWGLLAGAPSGIVVIDSDGDAGRRTTAALKAQGLAFTRTLTVITGREDGGKHRFYAVPPGVEIRNDQGRKLGPGLDVKGNGGYVVFPPSLHSSGERYRFDEPTQHVAELPQWIMDRLVGSSPKLAADEPLRSAITTGHRTRTFVSLAGTMLKTGMSCNAITAALLVHNAEQCSPPLPEAKIEALAADVMHRYSSGEIQPSASVDRMRVISLRDALQLRGIKQEWTWQGRLVAGTVSLLASKPKVGKSTFARNLAVAIARGEPFLGWKTKQGPVLYLCLEERVQDVAADFLKMDASAKDVSFMEASSIEALRDAVEKVQPSLVVVDPLFRLIRAKDENSYSGLYHEFGRIIDLARDKQVHILCLHHTSKIAKADAIDSPIGSTAIGGAISTLMYMRDRKEYRTLETCQRMGTNLPEIILEFDAELKRLARGGSRLDAELETLGDKILDVVAETPQTEVEIDRRIEGRTRNKRQVLRNLVRDGQLRRMGTGKRNDPFRYSKA